jgi:hypothetical protein
VAAYSQFLGYKVTVRYRVGEMLLSATGTFAADSGRSIFLEQHLEQRGTRKYFRWEIPYQYIHHIQAATEAAAADTVAAPPSNPSAKVAWAGAVESAGDGPSLGSIPQRPKSV